MQFFSDSKIQFMRYRRIWMSFSLVLLLLACVEIFIKKLNLGIDFAGGTQLTLKFSESRVHRDRATSRRSCRTPGFQTPSSRASASRAPTRC